jgi:hypothetical protein
MSKCSSHASSLRSLRLLLQPKQSTSFVTVRSHLMVEMGSQLRESNVRNAYGLCLRLRLGIISDTSLLSSPSQVSLPFLSASTSRHKKLTEWNLRGGKRERPLETVQPLASDLGLTVDTSCDRDDQDCVADLVNDYDGSGNILICWEHDQLTKIAEALGDDNAPDYPDDS